ncbi:MAG: carbohydrate binding family 9 domain-containing protein, partial [Acidobacteria bacterium]|nr:carbohydrate binding family 9 domain-containing protein [Acidobacteriota bacterium]
MLWFFVWFGVGSAVENTPVVPQIQADIQVDGELNEPVWDQALKLTLDYEVRPGENIQPPVTTTVRMFTSETHLYVAFFCADPNPQAIRSQFSDRDDVFNGDFAGIVLDTFNDQRRAYEFVCNPYGIQADAINDDLNGNYDLSWNALWTSKGKIQANGWSFEMKIPVHQLRFNPSDSAQIWGFDAFRSYPRSQRHHIGFFPRDRAVNSYLAQEAKLLGFSGLKPGKNLEVVPTVTGFQSETRPQFPNGGLEKTNDDTEAGVSVRWGITPNMTLNATANPDFSQVEADAVQLDINETFSLFYNETRPFFLEGADYFTTPFNLLHTRSIADPKGAMKLTGKSGKHTYGLLTAQDEQTTVVLPGVESSQTAQFDQNANDYVGRYRYDFGNNSTAGALLTAREGNGYHNQVLSFDSQYNRTSNDVFTVN